MQDVANLFLALYEDAHFEARFDSREMLQLATPMPLAQSDQSLKDAISNMLGGATFNEVGGAALGAIIGSFILPGIGTAIGAFLGGAAGSSANDDLLQRVYNEIMGHFNDIYQKVFAALDADVTGDDDHYPPIFQGLANNMERERSRFDALIKLEIERFESLRRQADQSAGENRQLAKQASAWSYKFDQFVAIYREAGNQSPSHIASSPLMRPEATVK